MDIGFILALSAAVTFAGSSTFIRRGVFQAGESFTAALIGSAVGVLFFSPALIFSGEWRNLGSFSGQGYVLLAMAGIVHFVVGRYFAFSAIRLIGANKASPLVSTTPIYAATFGVLFLNETLTTLLVLGVLSIATGVILISTEKQTANAEKQSQFPVRIKGMLFALGAGLSWGTSGVLIKPALAEVNSPLAGAFISSVAAALVIVWLLFRKEQRDQLSQLSRSSVLMLVMGNLLGSIAQLFRYIALSYSPVSRVGPLVSTSTVFVVLFSLLVNRKLEVFTWKVFAGIGVVAIGVFLIAH